MISCESPTVARNESASAAVSLGGHIRVEMVRAWPRRFESMLLDLPVGATVADALAQAGVSIEAGATAAAKEDTIVAVAVFGERVELSDVLAPGDRIELLRPLRVDPKEARRKRAQTAR
jgi:uncharacterized protein